MFANLAKKCFVPLLFLLSLPFFLLLNDKDTALAVPAAPIIHSLKQADGMEFQAKQWGDEWQDGWTTLDGYTILYDKSSKNWVYAKQDISGKPNKSSLIVGKDTPFGISRYLKPTDEVDLLRRRRAYAKSTPSTGPVKVPVVLINFSDTEAEYGSFDFQELLFGTNSPVPTGPGSMREYYSEVSYGNLSLSGEVEGWVTADHEHDYYGQDGGHGQKNGRSGELVKEAVQKVDGNVDFSQYDNDGDGYVDCVIVVHQGLGQEASRNTNDIWSHRYYLRYWDTGVYYTNDGVTVDSYTIQPEKAGSSMSTIGVFCHEFGHVLGLPDLYDLDSSSDGIGNWGLMSGGLWNTTNWPADTPAHPTTWCKWYLGWVSPIQIRGFRDDEPISQVETEGDVYQFLDNPGGPGDWNRRTGSGEYFLAENRQKFGFDAGLPGSGLLIWHIDESQLDNTNEAHKLVDLEAGDGKNDLDNPKDGNRGDEGDPFPGSSTNRTFNDSSNPNSKLYNGSASGVSVTEISDSRSVMRADFNNPVDILKPTQSAPANAGPKDNPNKIDVEVQIIVHALDKNDFDVQIEGKTASIVSVVELSDKYVLEVMPPTQDANDLYDLTVSVGSASDTEIDAIRYSEAVNIDVPLVIDRSGSMSGSKIADARNAAKQFVDLMSNGDQVSVVSFSGDARVDFPLTLITSSTVKEQAKSAIDSLYARGLTSIGDGLQFGQDQLTSNGVSEHAWAIILLSDGRENRPARVADVLPGIPDKTDVYTIALGFDADEALMQDIATETGGQYYFSPSSDQLREIYSLIRGQIAAEQTIISKSGTVNEGETKIETANVDSTISQATFGVNWSGSDIDLTLTDPNGFVIDPDVASTDPNISFTFGSTYEYYTVDSPASGGWQLNIEGVDTPWGGEDYTARVTGKSDLTLSAYFDKDRYEAGQPITVLVSLSDASGPITGASVEVIVQAPSQSLSAWKNVNGDTIPTKPLRESVSTLKSLYKASLNMKSPGQQSSNSPVFYLYDDGAHGDGQANDGVYGNLYTNTSNSGSYIFNFEASGKTNTGDPFTRITTRSLFVAQTTATGSISGTISYSGSQTGTIYIQSWQGDPTMYGNPDYLTSISSPGSYVLSNLPDSTYYLASYMDSNENGIRDENEPRGVYGPPHMPSSVIVSGGSQTSGIDITIIEGVISYPNPCYPNEGQTVKIANLPLNSKVHIYTISGELVRTLDDASEISTGGSSTTAFWDCKNDAGQGVARGIYIYLATDNVGSKKTGKIAIIK